MSDMKADDTRTDRDMRTDRDVRIEKESRTNPEVMGRTEPRTVGRVGGPGEVRKTNGGLNMWGDMSAFHGRFEQIQSEFIEDPKMAVEKAEKLIQEMLDHLMRSMHERMTTMHRELEGKTDTEQLRQTMRGYKEFINSFGHREAA